MLAERYSSLSVWNALALLSSWANARMTRVPARSSCAREEMSPNRSCTRREYRYIFRAKWNVTNEMKGYGRNDRRVSIGLMAIMRETDVMIARPIDVEYMMPGPITSRTAFRSLVKCAMRSPVFLSVKNAMSRRWTRRNSSVRRRYSIFRDAPMRSQRWK